MSAIFFLLQRKLMKLLRTASLYLSYEVDSKAISEHIYGLYIFLLLAGWTVTMLAFIVTGLGGVLALLKLSPADFDRLLFWGFGLGLALGPGLAQWKYDLYHFELADLDFLDNAPLSVPQVTLLWWVRGLFDIKSGIMVLVCGIVASAVSYVAKGNDWLALGLGLVAAAGYYGLANAWLWVWGLWRYRQKGPGPFSAWIAYAVSALGVAGLFLLPWARIVFWPASLASWLVTEAASLGNSLEPLSVAVAVGGILLTLIALLFGMYLIARTTHLAPAFEEGRLGGMFRLSAGNARKARTSTGEARLQLHLGRRLQKQRVAAERDNAPVKVARPQFQGVEAALLSKQWLWFRRAPLWQFIFSGLMLIVSGGGVALALATQVQAGAGFFVFVPVAYFANWSLMRLGVGPLRRELTHPDFFVSWPVSRLRLLIYLLLAGFGLPLVSGEIALVGAGIGGFVTWGAIDLWLLLWILLVLFSALVALFSFRHQLNKWSASSDYVPDIGTGMIILAGIMWLVVMLVGPQTGLFITASAVTIGYTFLKV
jgi:hypothetical protein